MAEMNMTAGKEEIVRDVFDVDDVESKTELRADQIEKVNKLKTMSSILGSGLLRLHVRDFMILQKSKDRQGLHEFVAALRSKKEELIDRGKMFFKNMLG